MNKKTSSIRITRRRATGAAVVLGVLAVGAALAWQALPGSVAVSNGPAAVAEQAQAKADRADRPSTAATPTDRVPIAKPDALHVQLRDSTTGRYLPGNATLRSENGAAVARTMRVGAAGERLGQLQVGEYTLQADVPGYRPLETPLHVGGEPLLPVTLWLSPREPSLQLDQDALAAVECGQCARLSGHVFDTANARAVNGAAVVAGDGTRTVTDADGRFVLTMKTSFDSVDPEALPPSTTLTVTKPGFQEQRFDGVLLVNDATDMVIDLLPGKGIQRRDVSHARVDDGPHAPGTTAHRVTVPPRADQDKAIGIAHPERAALAHQLASNPVTVPVPSSIRVGMNCSGRSCSSVSVYSLEDYVGRGLDDEWIASWHSQSLAAGAVAYRSYGAWFVANPVNSQYDICSTATCQVFRPNSVSSTIAAARATSGVILTRDGTSVAFSEYSSENNAWDNPNDGLSCSNPDLSCGDGNNGSPVNGWPCLSDSVGRGRGCYGHGRGMSQWGTQRWASLHDRDWKTITNHYFNGGNRPGGMRNAFLANVPTAGTQVLDTFESGVGRFNRAPTYSGSTQGVASSSLAEQSCSQRRNGSCSLRVLLRDDPKSAKAWSVRLLSGSGEPAANAPLKKKKGAVGFWVYAGGSGMSVGVSIDDSDGTERSVLRAVPAGKWTYVSWRLTDTAQWNAWAGGSNGAITASTVTLDAIWLHRAQTSYDVNVYIDDVQIRN